MTLDHFKEKHYMEEGTTKRNDLEKGYKKFTVSALRQKARLEEE